MGEGTAEAGGMVGEGAGRAGMGEGLEATAAVGDLAEGSAVEVATGAAATVESGSSR